MEEYRKPTNPPIGYSEATKALYFLEGETNKAIKAAAHELGRFLGFTDKQFWTHSIPEGLRAVLESFDNRAAELAAVAFLENRGYTVTRKGE